MDIFGLKPWKYVNISTFWTSSFYRLERRFFVLQSYKGLFPGLYWLKKERLKNGHFWTKPWRNPFWKMSIFRRFKLLVFYSLERRFFVLEYHERYFPGLYCLKKKLEKWPFLHQNNGLTPLEKCQFFDFLNLLFL